MLQQLQARSTRNPAERMQGNDNAKAAMADPHVRALYETMAAKENKRPYSMAVSDYFRGKDLLK